MEVLSTHYETLIERTKYGSVGVDSKEDNQLERIIKLILFKIGS